MKDGEHRDAKYYAKYERSLERIKDRYFFKTMAGHRVNHFSSCKIYQPQEVYGFAVCTCGLMADLDWIPDELANRVYPKYREDWGKNEAPCWKANPEPKYPYYLEPKPMSEEDKKEFSDFFGSKDKAVVTFDANALWTLIGDVFGFEHLAEMQEVFNKSDADKSNKIEYVLFEAMCPPEMRKDDVS